MRSARTLVNFISSSRIAIGLLFVLCFQRRKEFLCISVALFLIAFATDLLDGYVARKLRVASIYGRHWDSLGDKAFYMAAVVSFSSQGFLGPLVTWGFIMREIAIYITRILFIEKLPNIDRIWTLTKLHGYFMYLTIMLGLLQMRIEVNHLAFSAHPFLDLSAYGALVCGLGSMLQFIRL